MENSIIIHSGERFERVYLNTLPTSLHLIQDPDSTVRIHVIRLSMDGAAAPAKECTCRVMIDQCGPCRTEVYGLICLQGDEQMTLETHVHHVLGGGVSDQLIKFVLSDRAQGHFVGDLNIWPDAQQVEAHQTNRNLLLSDDAIMRTQPQLEINADDVQATHGASTGQLDETALFYMQQRGIDPEHARSMLVSAFMKDVIEMIGEPYAALREQLLNTIDGEIE